MALDDWPEIEPGPDGQKGKAGRRPFQLPPRPPARRPVRFAFGVRHIMILVLASALVVWVGQRIGLTALIVIGVTLLVATGTGALVLLFRSGAGMREAMLYVVANAAEKGLPLPEGIRAVGELCGRGFHWQAEQLARRLDAGASLPEALDADPGTLPPGTLVFTRMGWPPEHLARALRDVAAARSTTRGLARSWTVRIAYLVWTLIALQFIYAFMIYWVMPKFEAIFSDFGMALPWLTLQLVQFSHGLLGTGLVPIVLLAELAVLPLLPLAFFDPLHWNLPLADRFQRRRHGGIVARVLATEVEVGRPLPHSIEVLSANYPSSYIRRRLSRVAEGISAGASWHAALASVGLIRRVDEAVLHAAERARNLPWALRDLAGGVEQRVLLRLMGWSQVAFPLAVLLLAGMVLAFAAAFFLPLVKLIEELSYP